MFAIIDYKNNQLKVEEGKEYNIPYSEVAVGDKIVFDKILLMGDDKGVKTVPAELKDAKVETTVVSLVNDKKVSVVKFHSKKRYQKIGSHRQDYVRIKVDKIVS